MPQQDNQISEEYLAMPEVGNDNSEQANMEALQQRFASIP
jgi:hypothetical protein